MKFNYEKIAGGFFLLYLTSILVSTAGMEIFGWLLVLLMLIRVVLRKDWARAKLDDGLIVDRMLWVLLGLTIVAAWINGPEGLKVKAMGSMRWIFILYMVSFWGRTFFAKHGEKWFRYVSWLFIIIGIYSVYQFFFAYDLIRSKEIDPMENFGTTFARAQGPFNMPLTFAYSFGMPVLLLFAHNLIHLPHLKRGKFFFWSTFVILFVGVCAAFTRGSWLAFAFTLPLVLGLARPRWVAPGLVGALTLLVIGYFSSEMFRTVMTTYVTAFEGGQSDRFNLWQANWEMFNAHPLLGVGYNLNEFVVKDYLLAMGFPEDVFIGHAHNNFLQFLAGTGAFGFALFMAVFGYFLRLSWRLWKRTPEKLSWVRALALGGLGAQLYMHIGGLTECNFKDIEVNHMFILVLSSQLMLKHYVEQRQSSPHDT